MTTVAKGMAARDSGLEIRDRMWYVQSACATKGEGLYEGLEWMATQIRQKKAWF